MVLTIKIAHCRKIAFGICGNMTYNIYRGSMRRKRAAGGK
jgi:hypothetical protein